MRPNTLSVTEVRTPVMGVTMSAVAWKRISAEEIQQDIAEAAGHDFTIKFGVYGSWDSAGLARLNAYRQEIIASLGNVVAMTETKHRLTD